LDSDTFKWGSFVVGAALEVAAQQAGRPIGIKRFERGIEQFFDAQAGTNDALDSCLLQAKRISEETRVCAGKSPPGTYELDHVTSSVADSRTHTRRAFRN
jgi:hypothetical protein